MQKKGWLSIAGFILLMIAILYGGPYLSSSLNENYRKGIKKNGVKNEAVVISKRSHKGNSVHFKYTFKGLKYINHEQNDSIFESVRIGDTIEILLDSTEPSKSYIFR